MFAKLPHWPCLFVLSIALSSGSFASDTFPLRKDFPDTTPLSTEDLAAKYEKNDVIVVDVRSSFEYDTIHIHRAVHLPVAKKRFVKDLEAVRPKESTTPLAFYCNGTTCAKSYKAARAAGEAGFKNCFVYDAGIFEWTQMFPEWASLLGETPADPGKIISKSDLKKKMLAFDAFQTAAQNPQATVIDIRDPMQRRVQLDLPKVRNIPLDRIENFLSKGPGASHQLLIYDAVGKQVRWLQYHLEKHGYKDYAFLEGGVRAAIGDKKHY